jgi:integrase
VVSERLGHATIQLTLNVYAHVLPSMDRDAVNRYAAHLHGPA